MSRDEMRNFLFKLFKVLMYYYI